MNEPRTARARFLVPALVAVALVIVAVWLFRRNDAARGAEPSGQPRAEREDEPVRGEAPPPPPTQRMTRPPAEEATTPPPAAASLHDRLGGRSALHALAGKLLDVVQRNEVIMANVNLRAVLATVDARLLHDHITNFLCKATGGPCQYTGRTMKDSHAHLKITSAEWDAMIDDLAVVLVDLEVPAREAQELMELIGALEDDIVTR